MTAAHTPIARAKNTKSRTEYSFRQIEQNEWKAIALDDSGKEYTLGVVDGEPYQCSCKANSFGNICSHMRSLSTLLAAKAETSYVVIDTFEIEPTAWEAPKEVLSSTISLTGAALHGVDGVDSEFTDGLSDDQLTAFVLMLEWWRSGANEPFVLKGYAGTGKTFLIQRFVRYLQSVGVSKIAMMAPTHRAKSVLAGMAHKAGLSGVLTATMASLCHVTVTENYTADGHQIIDINKNSNSPYFDEFELVICDECSMVADEMIGYMPFKGNGRICTPKEGVKFRPIIFMGDPAQLPPVSKDEEPRESPVFERFTNGYQLTKIQRYAGAIAQYATSIRENLANQYPPKVISEGNLERSTNKDAWYGRLIELANEIETNPYVVRALAWRNKRVDEINKIVRSRLYSDAANRFMVYERLIAKEPIFHMVGDGWGGTKKAIALHTSDECSVSSVEVGFDADKRKIYKMTVTTDEQLEIPVLAIHEDSWDETERFLRQWKSNILQSDRDLRSSMWREYYQFLEKYCLTMRGNTCMNRLQYAYALTIHQSQGSTFENVFLDYADLIRCKEPTMRNRLLYTGATRASGNLSVLAIN